MNNLIENIQKLLDDNQLAAAIQMLKDQGYPNAATIFASRLQRLEAQATTAMLSAGDAEVARNRLIHDILKFSEAPDLGWESDLQIDALRVCREANGVLSLEIIARNPTEASMQLVELQLSFFGDAKPAGGLLSFGFNQASAAYDLVSDPQKGGLAVNAPDGTGYTADIVFPYAGQDYAEVSIPLAQLIKEDEADRFFIRVKTDALPLAGHRQVEGVIRYNGNRLSKPQVAPLPD